MGSILWAIFVIVLVVWLLGLIASIGGSLIHLLLIVAAAILIYNLTVGRNPRLFVILGFDTSTHLATIGRIF